MTVEVRDDNGEVVVETRPLWKKRRYLLVLLTFFGFINVYTLRINLSVGIVAMTENRTIEHPDGSVTYEQYFDWDSKQQGLVLSSFFYGYILTQVNYQQSDLNHVVKLISSLTADRRLCRE